MNSSRVYLERFAMRAAASIPPGAVVLDAGAGEGPYRHHFDHADYEAADFEQVPGKSYSGNHYVCDLAAIPVEDDRYDLVLFSQVLEHIEDPGAVLAELRRVLKPGGRIWASAPLFYEEHEQPYDFYRYTQFGLRLLFERAGFADLEIDWLEGYFGTISYELDVAARALETRPRWRRASGVVQKLSAAAAKADVRRRITSVGHPKNYTVVAMRPEDSHEDGLRDRYNCNQQEEWGERAQTAVALLEENSGALSGETPSRWNIADLGAGNERLRSLLASELKTSHAYHPYDLHPQKKTTKRLDVAQELPDARFDVVFCLGLLEYLPSVSEFAARLRRRSASAITSYVPSDDPTRISQAVRERNGWVNHLRREELEAAFSAAGWDPVATASSDGGATTIWLWKARPNP